MTLLYSTPRLLPAWCWGLWGGRWGSRAPCPLPPPDLASACSGREPLAFRCGVLAWGSPRGSSCGDRSPHSGDTWLSYAQPPRSKCQPPARPEPGVGSGRAGLQAPMGTVRALPGLCFGWPMEWWSQQGRWAVGQVDEEWGDGQGCRGETGGRAC